MIPTGSVLSTDIRAEVGATTGSITLGAACPREIAGIASGNLGYLDFRGKTITPMPSIPTTVQNGFSGGFGTQIASMQVTFFTNGNASFFITRGGSASTAFALCSQAASNFQVQFTYSNLTGSPSISNGASTWQTITANRTTSASVTTSQFQPSQFASGTLTVGVRRANITSVVFTKTFNFSIGAEEAGGPVPF